MRVEIQNFQSLGYADLSFRKPITFITGQSNVGKTAIFRAIKYFFLNKQGGSFIRDGEEVMSVGLHDGGSAAIWKKSVSANKRDYETVYVVQGEEYKRTGGRPVQDVLDLFNIRFVSLLPPGELVNFWDQMSFPFLLDKTSSQLFDFITFMDMNVYTGLLRVQKNLQDDLREKRGQEKVLAGQTSVLTEQIGAKDVLLSRLSVVDDARVLRDALLNSVSKLEILLSGGDGLVQAEQVLDRALSLSEMVQGGISFYKKVDEGFSLYVYLGQLFDCLEDVSVRLSGADNAVTVFRSVDYDLMLSVQGNRELVESLEVLVKEVEELDSRIFSLQVKRSACELLSVSIFPFDKLVQLGDMKSFVLGIDENLGALRAKRSVFDQLVFDISLCTESTISNMVQITDLGDWLFSSENTLNAFQENMVKLSNESEAVRKELGEFEVCPLCGQSLLKESD